MTEKKDWIKMLWELASPKADPRKLSSQSYWNQHYGIPIWRGDYGALERAWEKLVKGKDEEYKANLYLEIELSVQAQTRYRIECKRAGEFVPQPVILSKFLNAKRWKDDIGSHAELKEKIKELTCQCGKPTKGNDFKYCDDCLPESPRAKYFTDLLNKKIDDLELNRKPNEPMDDYRIRLRKAYIQGSNNLQKNITSN